mmetsp:Transcript_8185/g.20075  ORF Transcript_8185/g.20075 Transcript_8185/m.20075 type:complete len:337 (+) Transcript_8185:970-1980(+)
MLSKTRAHAAGERNGLTAWRSRRCSVDSVILTRSSNHGVGSPPPRRATANVSWRCWSASGADGSQTRVEDSETRSMPSIIAIMSARSCCSSCLRRACIWVRAFFTPAPAPVMARISLSRRARHFGVRCLFSRSAYQRTSLANRSRIPREMCAWANGWRLMSNGRVAGTASSRRSARVMPFTNRSRPMMPMGLDVNASSSARGRTPATSLRTLRPQPRLDSRGVTIGRSVLGISIMASVISLARFGLGIAFFGSGQVISDFLSARKVSISFRRSWKACPMLLNIALKPLTSFEGSTLGTAVSWASFGFVPKMRRIDISSPFEVVSFDGSRRVRTEAR